MTDRPNEEPAAGRPSRPKRPSRPSGGAARAAADVAGTTYTVDVDGATTVVTVTPDGVLVEGQTIPAALLTVPNSPIRLLRLGDAVFELVSRRGERRGTHTIALAGARVETEALDERARVLRSLRAAAVAPTGPQPVRAPMPGLVTRVLVAVGDMVRAGDSLIVMEAMKMENELRAKVSGRVHAVTVGPGTAVDKGALLIELEEER